MVEKATEVDIHRPDFDIAAVDTIRQFVRKHSARSEAENRQDQS